MKKIKKKLGTKPIIFCLSFHEKRGKSSNKFIIFALKFGKMGKNREIRSFLSGLKFKKIKTRVTSSPLLGLECVKMDKSREIRSFLSGLNFVKSAKNREINMLENWGPESTQSSMGQFFPH